MPPRFLELKKELMGGADQQAALRASWARLVPRLAAAADEIAARGTGMVPEVEYEALLRPSAATAAAIKACGTFVARGVVPAEEAQAWLRDTEAYIAANPRVRGFPADDKQVFELYWARTQLAARGHPRALAAQRALLGFFRRAPDDEVALEPMTYADRLRIRHPGDSRFALGPHMDGGSIERWEDPTYRAVYSKILEGKWEEFDAWEISESCVGGRRDAAPPPTLACPRHIPNPQPTAHSPSKTSTTGPGRAACSGRSRAGRA